MDVVAELGRNPVSKHQIQPEYGDEQADAGRNPSREAKFSGTHGDRGIFFPVQLTTSRIGNLTRLIHTLLYVMTVPTSSKEHFLLQQPYPVDPYSAICDDHTHFV